MRKFAILGYPLGHTMSPPIHRRLFELSGHEGDEYSILEIAPEDLEQRLEELKGLDGLNVTIPHKVAMLHQVSRLDDTAKRYQAVNVISWENGEWVGYNTDCYGFRKAAEVLGAGLSDPVCVLGAGGVGRMFAIESALCGAPVTIAVRESGLSAARQVRQEILALQPEAAVEIADLHNLRGRWNLLINATPVGMYPQVGSAPVDASALGQFSFVFDSIYNPETTLLLQMAKEAGCKTIGGMAMLVWQAVRAHEIWDGARYETGCIQELIAEMSAMVEKAFR